MEMDCAVSQLSKYDLARVKAAYTTRRVNFEGPMDKFSNPKCL